MPEKKLVVLGAGESGASAARLGRRAGYAVFVSDAGNGHPDHLNELREAGIDYETGGHTGGRLLQADLVVKSPGIPDTAAIVRQLAAAGIPIISEIEFAARYVDPNATVVAITGSNGKTTTTLLTHHLLKSAGERVVAGGNLGESLARLLLDEAPQDIYVLEVSSFQLDGCFAFRPDIAAVLNITPDHLDRYDYRMETYADSKLRITRNQHPGDRLLLLDDPVTIAPALRRNSSRAEVLYVRPKEIIKGATVQVEGAQYDLRNTQLAGRHNAMNAAFAIQIARWLGVSEQEIRIGLESFRPAPHRMEIIPTTDGRHWINDSKATNVDSTYFALESMTAPTVWIAGGTDKGNEYGALDEVIDRVHCLICLGVDNEKLIAHFGERIDRLESCDRARRAVELADEIAEPGDTILLSPACASFDLFKNYMDRGDQFRAAVQALTS